MTSLVIIGAVVVLVCGASAKAFSKRKTKAKLIQLIGSALLLVMVFTHVAERFHLLIAMRWGRPDSPGHYLDLISAVAGISLLCTGSAIRLKQWAQRSSK